MLVRERQFLIEKRLAADGKVVAADLANEFAVSEDTIRRDLRDMAAAGLCDRVYGGALAVDVVTPLAERMNADRQEKVALAGHVAALLRPGMSVFIDAGSTNLEIVRALPRGHGASIITHAPAIAAHFADDDVTEVIMIGGIVTPGIGACVDARAMRDMEMFKPDLFIMGICGLDEKGSVTAEHHADALFKRQVADASGRVIVPLTKSKLDRRERYKVMDLNADCLLVTTNSNKTGLARHVMHGCAVEIVREPH